MPLPPAPWPLSSARPAKIVQTQTCHHLHHFGQHDRYLSVEVSVEVSVPYMKGNDRYPSMGYHRYHSMGNDRYPSMGYHRYPRAVLFFRSSAGNNSSFSSDPLTSGQQSDNRSRATSEDAFSAREASTSGNNLRTNPAAFPKPICCHLRRSLRFSAVAVTSEFAVARQRVRCCRAA